MVKYIVEMERKQTTSALGKMMGIMLNKKTKHEGLYTERFRLYTVQNRPNKSLVLTEAKMINLGVDERARHKGGSDFLKIRMAILQMCSFCKSYQAVHLRFVPCLYVFVILP